MLETTNIRQSTPQKTTTNTISDSTNNSTGYTRTQRRVAKFFRALGLGFLAATGMSGATGATTTTCLDKRDTCPAPINPYLRENFLTKNSENIPSDIKNIDNLSKNTREDNAVNKLGYDIINKVNSFIAKIAASNGIDPAELSSEDYESTKYIKITDFVRIFDKIASKLVATDYSQPQINVEFNNSSISFQLLLLNKENSSVDASTTFELNIHPKTAKYAMMCANPAFEYDLFKGKHRLFGAPLDVISKVDERMHSEETDSSSFGFKDTEKQAQFLDIIKDIENNERAVNLQQQVNHYTDKICLYDNVEITIYDSEKIKMYRTDIDLVNRINQDSANNFDFDVSDIDTQNADSIIDYANLDEFVTNQRPIELKLDLAMKDGNLTIDNAIIDILQGDDLMTDITQPLIKLSTGNAVDALKLANAMDSQVNVLVMLRLKINEEHITIPAVNPSEGYKGIVKILADREFINAK